MEINMKKINESFNALISETDGYYFNYSAGLAIALENTSAAIMLCYLVHFEGKGHLSKGWIYKTMEDMRGGTGLTRYQQDTAIKILQQHGFIEYKRSGFHGMRHYRVDTDAIATRLMSLWKNSKHRPQTKRIKRKQDSDKPANSKFAENQHPYTEETLKKTDHVETWDEQDGICVIGRPFPP